MQIVCCEIISSNYFKYIKAVVFIFSGELAMILDMNLLFSTKLHIYEHTSWKDNWIATIITWMFFQNM